MRILRQKARQSQSEQGNSPNGNELHIDNTLSANTERMEAFMSIISERFNLGVDYVLTGLQDKGKTLKMTVVNSEFEVAVTAKDTESLDIPV